MYKQLTSILKLSLGSSIGNEKANNSYLGSMVRSVLYWTLKTLETFELLLFKMRGSWGLQVHGINRTCDLLQLCRSYKYEK